MKYLFSFFYFVTILTLLMPTLSFAQQTYYYKMIKKIITNKSYVHVSGGQFITFYSKICYESTKDGISIGHGQLQFYSDNGKIVKYSGRSYWDDDSFFCFNHERSRLNVLTSSGDIYVYTRATAPSFVKTCSLIRGASSYNGIGNNPISPMQENSFKTETKSTTGSKKTKRICHYCNGKGKTVRNLSTGQYGVKDEVKVRCNECGEYYLPSTGHSHIHCSHCHGTGYLSD